MIAECRCGLEVEAWLSKDRTGIPWALAFILLFRTQNSQQRTMAFDSPHNWSLPSLVRRSMDGWQPRDMQWPVAALQNAERCHMPTLLSLCKSRHVERARRRLMKMSLSVKKHPPAWKALPLGRKVLRSWSESDTVDVQFEWIMW